MRVIRSAILVLAGSMLITTGWSTDRALAAGGDCQFEEGRRGGCTSGAIADGAVDVQARESEESSEPAAKRNRMDVLPSGPHVPVGPPPVPRGRLAADVDVPCHPGVGGCFDEHHAFLPPAKAPTKPADPVPVAPPAPGVTLQDVAQFVPRSASIRSQPNGWAVAGAPVNLLTDAAAQVVDGTLLGRPAQVRFVPVAFTWDYGDGTTSTTAGPGASWRELGQPDFTATDTSHVFPGMGDRQVSLTITYSPSYRFDGGAWQQIPGTLPVRLGPVTIHVLQGSTVLVGGACGTRDAGPGC
jgi:hypothetical protein